MFQPHLCVFEEGKGGKERVSSSHIMKEHRIESDLANLKMSDHKVQHFGIGVEARRSTSASAISSK